MLNLDVDEIVSEFRECFQKMKNYMEIRRMCFQIFAKFEISLRLKFEISETD